MEFPFRVLLPVSPGFRKTPHRVEALAWVILMAYLIYAIMQHRVRHSLAKRGRPLITPGNRKDERPTGRSIPDMLVTIHTVRVRLPDGSIRLHFTAANPEVPDLLDLLRISREVQTLQVRVPQPIHPFPARMAPDIAFQVLAKVSPKTVLDPMAGSGTVLRIASDAGCRGIGFDLDPMAVLIARVWTTPVDPGSITAAAEYVVDRARRLSPTRIRLPWLDEDSETNAFVAYWFADPQLGDLRRLAWVLHRFDESPLRDALWVALSRTIITKDVGASLARDVSHSRPHRVRTTSEYDVFLGFRRAAARIDQVLGAQPPRGEVAICQGDARNLRMVPDGHVDLIITSPPYLNAIDYMRAHRLSLVWMGFQLRELRTIRASSVGCERALSGQLPPDIARHLEQVGPLDRLPPRWRGIVGRYVIDLTRVVAEAARVLRPNGHLVLVMGDTSLYGTPIRNSAIACSAAAAAGLTLESIETRDLLAQRRYLPPPDRDGPGIQRRIGTETILTFRKSPSRSSTAGTESGPRSPTGVGPDL